MKSIKSVCSACQECCKKYNITLLPKEAKKIAEKLKLTEKEFIEKNCDLSLQFFPFSKSEKHFVLHSTQLPKKLLEKLKKNSNLFYFFVLPNIMLKKTEKSCIFLENGLCQIYKVRPKQCVLFPAIFLGKENELKKKYSFCDLLKQGFKSEKNFEENSLKHYKNVKDYFDLVKEKGFESVWKELPRKGTAFFKDQKLCKITKNEFLKVIETFK